MSATAPPEPSAARMLGALALGAFAISLAAIFFRLAAPVDPLLASALRLALAALALAWPAWRARRAGRLGADVLRAGAWCGLAYAVHFGAWVASLGMTSVAASVTLVTATPLMLAMVALVTGTDLPGARVGAALVIAGAGIVLIGAADASGGPDGSLLGDALALVGAAAMGVYLLVARRLGSALDALAFSAIAAGVGALLLAASCLARVALGGSIALPGAEALGWIALSALIPQLVGHTLLTWALRRATPVSVGLATMAEPVFSTLLAWAWLGEIPAGLVLAGCALTLAGIGVGVTRPAPLRNSNEERSRPELQAEARGREQGGT